MKTHHITFLIIALICGGNLTAKDKLVDTPEKMFKNFDQGVFYERPPGKFPIVSTGPNVPISADRKVHCSVLVYQAQLLAANHGEHAFDIAFKSLDDEKVHIRWIAVYALKEVTGRHPIWFMWGIPGETFNADKNWSDRAKKEWKKWKAEQDASSDR